MVPTWVAILTAVSGAGVGLFINPVTEVVKARAAKSENTAKSNREAIFKAVEWFDSDRMETKQLGWDTLMGLTELPSLSKDDAVLLDALTRRRAGPELSEAAALRRETG